MKENYERTRDFILLQEGNMITNTVGDRGGLTGAYGLTLRTMKALHLDLNHDGVMDAKDIPLVTKEVVDQAFHAHFWDRIFGDRLAGGIDLLCGDLAWNSGPDKPLQFIREGFGGSIEAFTDRRIRFYLHLSMEPGQRGFLHGWVTRALDAKVEAAKCEK